MTNVTSQVFGWPIRIYFEDTDATGVVYHANYLRYFERARSEWLRARDFTHERMLKEHGAVFTLTDVNVSYLKPARLGDVLEATAEVAETSRITMTFAQTLRRPETPSDVLTRASVRVVCVDALSFKPRAWPPGWLPGGK